MSITGKGWDPGIEPRQLVHQSDTLSWQERFLLPFLQLACKVLGYHSGFDARSYGKQTELQGTVEQVNRPACSFLLPQEAGGWESDEIRERGREKRETKLILGQNIVCWKLRESVFNTLLCLFGLLSA